MQQPEVEMNVFEAILARRSVRNFTAQDVDRTTVRILLEAAVRAPTAMHEEPWAFVVIQDRQLLRHLSDRARPIFTQEMRRSGVRPDGHALKACSDPDSNIFHDAGTLIVIGARPAGPFVAADCWLAAENLMLAACAMRLGTCVIGAALPALNVAEVKAELGIPGEFSAIVPIIVGHPCGETAPNPRKEPLVLTRLPIVGN